MADAQERTPLWDDNPSDLDLLGFDAVVAPIVDAIGSPDLDPLTIGIHARWGAGKSTILKLVSQRLAVDPDVLVIETNPWEYDDHDDVKGTLIAEVLDALREHFDGNAAVVKQIGELLSRISWQRVGKTVAKGMILQSLDLKELVQAFTPKRRSEPETMAGFKGAFEKLVTSLPNTKRVVVLVDDLDRCMPPATVATLEAIKLFLSVPGMAFVIAADQEMVRDAIALNLGGSAESSRFAQRYLEKIVQLPVTLPYLPLHDAEAYLGLLLARESVTGEDFTALVGHAASRRLQAKTPLLAEMGHLGEAPDDEVLRLASQLVHGLRGDKVVNPREIKRFLNAFQIRRRIAQARGVKVKVDVLAKLLLLEDRFSVDVEALANTAELERSGLLDAWERWGREEEGSDKPERVTAESRQWAGADPKLSGETLGPYLTLAASLAIARQVGTPLDPELTALIDDLSSDTEAVRRSAIESVSQRSTEDQRTAVTALFAHARRQDEGGRTITSLIEIAAATPDLAQDIATGLKENSWKQIAPDHAVDIASSAVPAIKSLAQALADDATVDPAVAMAVKNVLEGGDI